MRAFLVLLVLFVGCKSLKNSRYQSDVPIDLQMLSQYLSEVSKDTVQKEIVKNYKTLNLTEQWKNNQVLLIVNGIQSFSCDHSNREFWFEVYKDNFLVVSIITGASNAPGPDDIDRSTTVIIDINNGLVKTVNLQDVRLTRSVEYLNHLYPPRIDKKPSRYHAIQSIDGQANQMTLINIYGDTTIIQLESPENEYICK